MGAVTTVQKTRTREAARTLNPGYFALVMASGIVPAQGVIVPVAVWEKLLEAAEDELDTELARGRLAQDNGRQLSRAEVNEVFDRLRAGRSA